MRECRVVVVGDKLVGKSSVIRRFIQGDFSEDNQDIPANPQQTTHTVDNQETQFCITELGDISQLRSPPHALLNSDSYMVTPLVTPDVFLLCFFISSLSSLHSAITNWIPTLSAQFADTPVILVGCQADRRILSSGKKLSVSAERALAFSRQCGAVMYVETSAKISDRTSIAAFDVAALTCLGQFSRQSSTISVSSHTSSVGKTRSKSSSKRDRAVQCRSTSCHLNCLTPSPLYQSHQSPPLTLGCKTASLSSHSLLSKSSTNSDTSVVSIFTYKTPLQTRRVGKKGKGQGVVTIKCQRLNIDKEVEEVEIEVPHDIYKNIESGSDKVYNSIESGSDGKVNNIDYLGSKLKYLLLR